MAVIADDGPVISAEGELGILPGRAAGIDDLHVPLRAGEIRVLQIRIPPIGVRDGWFAILVQRQRHRPVAAGRGEAHGAIDRLRD